jgi:hypothetical protein
MRFLLELSRSSAFHANTKHPETMRRKSWIVQKMFSLKQKTSHRSPSQPEEGAVSAVESKIGKQY